MNPNSFNVSDTVKTLLTTPIVHDGSELSYGAYDCRKISESQFDCITNSEHLEWYWNKKRSFESSQVASCSILPNIADTISRQFAYVSPMKQETSSVTKSCLNVVNLFTLKFEARIFESVILDTQFCFLLFVDICYEGLKVLERFLVKFHDYRHFYRRLSKCKCQHYYLSSNKYRKVVC